MPGGVEGQEQHPALRRGMSLVPNIAAHPVPAPPCQHHRACTAVPHCELSQGRLVSLNLSGFDQAFRPGAERLPPMTVSSKRLHFYTNPWF